MSKRYSNEELTTHGAPATGLGPHPPHRRKDDTMTNTLTGHRSFRATIVPPRCTVKSHVSCACEQPDTLEFDASDAVSKPAQAQLFKDYADTAKALKLGGATHRREAGPKRIQYAGGGTWFDAPKFTAVPMAKNERHWLGREVGFRSYDANVFAPVGDGVRVGGSYIIRGTVWSLAPYPKCFWVYVAGQGFYSVREDDFKVGVNA